MEKDFPRMIINRPRELAEDSTQFLGCVFELAFLSRTPFPQVLSHTQAVDGMARLAIGADQLRLILRRRCGCGFPFAFPRKYFGTTATMEDN